MTGKLFVIMLALFAHQGSCVREIRLEDRNLLYIRHPLLGTAISVPKDFRDTLSTCHVIFPNRVMYEAFPNDNIPHANVNFLTAAQPFTSCGIGFRDVGPEFSGTYELLSTVIHSSDNSVSLTRQNFNLVVRESDFTKSEKLLV